MIHLEPPINIGVSIDLAHNALLLGMVASLKPDRVCDIGFGNGYTADSISQALQWNKKGTLTIVENWQDSNGIMPLHAKQWSTVYDFVTFTESSEEAFIKSCPYHTFDILVSDADHSNTHKWITETFKIVRPGGVLFFHDTNSLERPNLAGIVEVVKRRRMPHFHFTESSRPEERCHRGWLMVKNEEVA
jgi:predicted O-methyltransferase YrrM